MSELADRLVKAAEAALDDYERTAEYLRPGGDAVAVVAVLREIGTWGAMQKYPVNLFTTLADQIESGRSDG